jgi:hypothetical protein
MRADQVTQIRGFADQSLRDPAKPNEATNRRVTLIILYQSSGSAAAAEPLPVQPKPSPVSPRP